MSSGPSSARQRSTVPRIWSSMLPIAFIQRLMTSGLPKANSQMLKLPMALTARASVPRAAPQRSTKVIIAAAVDDLGVAGLLEARELDEFGEGHPRAQPCHGRQRFQDTAAKYFRGFPLSRVRCFGFSEDVDEGLARMRRVLDLPPGPLVHALANPARGAAGYEIEPSVQRRIEQCNRGDYRLWHYAREREGV